MTIWVSSSLFADSGKHDGYHAQRSAIDGGAKLWTDTDTCQMQAGVPRVHTGFLERARAVSIQSLYKLAKGKGLRLVLCGRDEPFLSSPLHQNCHLCVYPKNRAA